MVVCTTHTHTPFAPYANDWIYELESGIRNMAETKSEQRTPAQSTMHIYWFCISDFCSVRSHSLQSVLCLADSRAGMDTFSVFTHLKRFNLLSLPCSLVSFFFSFVNETHIAHTSSGFRGGLYIRLLFFSGSSRRTGSCSSSAPVGYFFFFISAILSLLSLHYSALHITRLAPTELGLVTCKRQDTKNHFTSCLCSY